jgi:hypothetical protein
MCKYLAGYIKASSCLYNNYKHSSAHTVPRLRLCGVTSIPPLHLQGITLMKHRGLLYLYQHFALGTDGVH